MSQTKDEADIENRYPIRDFIKKTKDDLGLGKVRVLWTRFGHRASALENGMPEMRIPTVPTIMQEMKMSEEEAIAKQKMAIIEENCHIKLKQVEHTPELCGCVRVLRDRHMNEEERKLTEGKLERLESACRTEAKETDGKEDKKLKELFLGTTLDGAIEAGKVIPLNQFVEKKEEPVLGVTPRPRHQ